MSILRFSVLLPLSLLVLSGCGGSQKTAVTGSVTYDGEPVAFGELIFVPESGPQGSATIRDGKYNTAEEDGQGIVPGPHRVLVTVYPYEPIDTTDDETAETMEGAAAEPLFVNYEMSLQVSGSTLDISVPADAKDASARATADRVSSDDP